MECDVLTRNCDHTRIAGAGGGLVRAVAQSVIEGSVGSRVGQRIETPEMVSYLERVTTPTTRRSLLHKSWGLSALGCQRTCNLQW